MVEVIGDAIICGKCHTRCTKEMGYYLCPACGWRLYSDPRTDPYHDEPCPGCGYYVLNCLRQCPICGTIAD